MFSFRRARPKRSAPVKIQVVNAIELNPYSNYILFVDGDLHKRPEVESMLKDLKSHGVRNVVSFMLSGSPDEAIQVISKEKRHAPSKTRH